MEHLRFHHAAPLPGEAPDAHAAAVLFDTVVPEAPPGAGYCQGLKLADALLRVLPGASVDGLLTRLLERRACQLRTAYPTVGGADPQDGSQP